MIYHMSPELQDDGSNIVPCCGRSVNDLGPDDSVVIPEGERLNCRGYLDTLPPPVTA